MNKNNFFTLMIKFVEYLNKKWKPRVHVRKNIISGVNDMLKIMIAGSGSLNDEADSGGEQNLSTFFIRRFFEIMEVSRNIRGSVFVDCYYNSALVSSGY